MFLYPGIVSEILCLLLHWPAHPWQMVVSDDVASELTFFKMTNNPRYDPNIADTARRAAGLRCGVNALLLVFNLLTCSFCS